MKRALCIIILLAFLIVGAAAQQKLTLDECISIALENNPDIKTANSQLGIAKANRLLAYSAIMPTLRFSSSPMRHYRAPSTYEGFVSMGQDPETGEVIYGKAIVTSPANTTKNYNANFTWSQNLWDNGRWWNQIRQGRSAVHASEYGLRSTVISTVLAVNERYYELLKLLEQRRVLEESVLVAEEQLKNSQSMFEIGTVAQIDVFRSRVNLGNNQLLLLNHELRIEDANNQINIVLGRDVRTPVDIETNVQVEINYNLSLDELMNQGIQSHPQLKQLEQNVWSSELDVKIQKSMRYPRISYVIQYQRSNSNYRMLYENINHNYGFYTGLNINFDIFDGFETRSNIQRSRNQLQINQESFQNTKRIVQSNIRNYCLQLQQFMEKMKISRESVESAGENLRMANERYRVGSGTLIETIDAQAQLTNARYSLVEMQYNAKIAEARLHAATGNLHDKYSSPISKK